MKTFEEFTPSISNNIWFRGYTTLTTKNNYIWLTRSEKHANQYSEINTIMYGGEPIIQSYELDLTNINILDLSMYDMDDKLSESECEDFLDDCDVYYNYDKLFDFSEDEIPLSRLVNQILTDLVDGHDGFVINESDVETIYISTRLCVAEKSL